MDQCPEGLKSLTIQMKMNKVFERWQVYDSQNTLLFDQLNDYRSNGPVSRGSEVTDYSNENE